MMKYVTSWFDFALLLVLILSYPPVTTVRAQETRQQQHPAAKPHIIFIVLDDLGSHDLGIHGSGILTPNTDQLVNEGVYLSNYYTLSSCTQTRIAFMTGKYPYASGIYDVVRPRVTYGINPNDETIAQALRRKANYTSHAIGKWHMGNAMYEHTPTYLGFESFMGYYGPGQLDYFTHKTTEGEDAYGLRYDKHEFCGQGCSEIVDERGNYSTHVFTREAMRAIQQHSGGNASENPLFLYVAYQAVHYPWQVPQNYIDMYNRETNWTDNKKIYAGMLTAADEGIGQIVAELQAAGMWEESLVVVTTDNGGPVRGIPYGGWSPAEGTDWGVSNYPLRGGKLSVFEGGISGDALLAGGALATLGIEMGKPNNALFHALDWLPTLFEMVGISKPEVVNRQQSCVKNPLTGKMKCTPDKEEETEAPTTSELMTESPSQADEVASVVTQTPITESPTTHMGGISQYNALRTGEPARKEFHGGYTRMRSWGNPFRDSAYLMEGIKLIWNDRDNSALLYNLTEDVREEFDLSGQLPLIQEQLKSKLDQAQSNFIEQVPSNAAGCTYSEGLTSWGQPALHLFCNESAPTMPSQQPTGSSTPAPIVAPTTSMPITTAPATQTPVTAPSTSIAPTATSPTTSVPTLEPTRDTLTTLVPMRTAPPTKTSSDTMTPSSTSPPIPGFTDSSSRGVVPFFRTSIHHAAIIAAAVLIFSNCY